MEQANGFLNRYIVPSLTALSENTYMSAIRAGMVSIVPLTIIGGVFMIVAEPPVPAWEEAVKPYRHLIQVPVTGTFGLLSVFVCFAIGYDLGQRLKQEAVVSAILATVVFLMIQIAPREEHVIKLGHDDLVKLQQDERDKLDQDKSITLSSRRLSDFGPKELIRIDEMTIPINNLGSKGLFTAIVVSLIAVCVQKFFTDYNLVIRLPASVPSVVYESFLSLIPLFFLVMVFWLIRFVLGIDINALVQHAFSPLVFALNSLPGILVYAFLVTMLWSVGINGDNALDAIVAPIFYQYLAANAEATTQGQPLPFITANGFFTTFVNVGGTGATIALALVLWNSRDPGLRKVSRLSLPTQIFQINEPILFGIPIVLNPIFMIPYILNALILTASTYLLMYANVIHKPFVNVPWTTPPIIGHFLVTGGDWRAAVWGVLSIAIAMCVYYPFAKVAERQRLQAEATHERSEPAAQARDKS